MTQLPIDVVAGTDPPKFRWQQTASTPAGDRRVDCTGTLPPSVEVAVVALVVLARKLSAENAELQKREQKHLDLAKSLQAQVASLNRK